MFYAVVRAAFTQRRNGEPPKRPRLRQLLTAHGRARIDMAAPQCDLFTCYPACCTGIGPPRASRECSKADVPPY